MPHEKAVKDEKYVKAILEFTEVDLEVVEKAKQDGTLTVLERLIAGFSSYRFGNFCCDDGL
jgi:hypothetical protein